MKRGRIGLVLILTFMLSLGLQLLNDPFAPANNELVSSRGTLKNVTTDIAETPIRSAFYENIGQINHGGIMFYGSVSGGMIGFASGKVLLWLGGMQDVVELRFEGAESATPIGIDLTSHRINYFLGERGSYTGVTAFKRVSYESLWPGISLTYRMTDAGVKYEFELSPGANPEDISIRSFGQDRLVVSTDTLELEVGDHSFVDGGLVALQKGSVVEARFVKHGEDTFGFEVGDYDEQETLLIDPLIYSTYVGGSADERANALTVDSSGNAYVTGTTTSTDFPVVSPYDGTFNLQKDCFVFKLNATGNGLVYATFVGGSGDDFGESIAIDSEGNAYITGYTVSSDFPTYLGFDSSQEGGDSFVVKLNPNGDALVYSTLLGGSGKDWARSIAVSPTNNVYVTGGTSSTDFPAVNAYDGSFNGGVEYYGGDSFICKLEDDGSSLLYSTYVGGGDIDQARSIAVDSAGNAYVAGHTNSSDFPTVGPYDSSFNGGTYDVFALKLSSDGSSLAYSTFIGGSAAEFGYALAVDASGNAYVTGVTASSDFPVINAYNSTMNENGDCFVFKLSATGSSLIYSTFVGGSGYEYGWSIAVDSNGNAYVAGGTASTDFPMVDAYDSSYNGGSRDGIVFKLSSGGDSLLYSTYVGGSDGDYGYSVATDSAGGVFVCGQTESADIPTLSAYDSSYSGGNYDCFVIKLDVGDAIPTDTIPDIFPIVVAGAIGVASAIVILVLYTRRRR